MAASVVSFVPASSLKYFLQALQYQYSVFPASVQVAALLSLLLQLMSCRRNRCGCKRCFPVCACVHHENTFRKQCSFQYSMFPASVQVAALPVCLTQLMTRQEVAVSVR